MGAEAGAVGGGGGVGLEVGVSPCGAVCVQAGARSPPHRSPRPPSLTLSAWEGADGRAQGWGGKDVDGSRCPDGQESRDVGKTN